jgi:bifunctional N-acetylglucosamine-1-phosphate-uridyltransferase/glucosamine-1-phosphate-acetyltransferase GlmU-like protein
VCETGAIQCLQAGHKVLTKEQSEATLRQRLERMQRELLTENRQKEVELSDLCEEVEKKKREVVLAEQRRDAKLSEVQESKKHLGSLEHLLDAQRCKFLSAEALPFMVHVRAFERRSVALLHIYLSIYLTN